MMRRYGFRLATVLAMAAVTGLPVSAQAQSLFDLLFGNQRARQRDFRPLPPEDYKPIKISAPIYYTYKTDPIVKVSFSKTLSVPAPSALEPSLSSTGFLEARGALSALDLSADKPVAEALDTYYSDNPDFVWVTGFAPNAKAQAALEVLSRADEEGLSSSDYVVKLPDTGFDFANMAARRNELMRFEMSLSARVLRYVSDARTGRINPNRLSGYHDFPAKPLDLAATLDQLKHADDVATYLETRHPGSKQYAALKAELAALRQVAENEIVINDLKFLKPGGSDPEFPKVLQIIERESPEAVLVEFAGLLENYRGSEVYALELVPLIKAAQQASGTTPDGIIGRMTIKALFGVSKQDKIDKVVLAMERLRWLPSDLGSRHVFVNQPAFMGYYVNGGQVQLSTRVVVGKRSNQTSFFYDEIEQIDYNPYWGVPQSILINEMLPKLVEDPGYLDRAGYEVTTRSGQRISSASVDWWQYRSEIPFNVRQIPSEANALGELKILFPNKHAIYMHDTPAKNLFSRETRAYSHGCIRLQKPREMAAAVLGKSVEYIEAQLRKGHSSEKVPVKIPVYVSYFTAWPDDAGVVGFYADMYGRDEHLLKAVDAVEKSRNATG